MDASGVTATGAAGVVTFTANNVASTIKGGAGNDVLTGVTQYDTIEGGAGVDIIVFADNDSTTAAAVTITDYSADVIRLVAADNVAGAGAAGTNATTDVQVAVGGKVTFAAADDTLAEKLVALAADTTDIAADEVVFFEHGSDTYIFNNVGGTDDLIKLAGVTDFVSATYPY